MSRRRPLRAALAVVLAASTGLGTTAQAQIYRSVDAAGNIVYSDQPAAGADALTGTRAPASTQQPALPHALRQAQARYPVVLYTSPQCTPCQSARQYLLQRGVPFTEKTIPDQANVRALQERTGSTELPLLSLGTKSLRGYAPTQWAEYLDAAGYPQEAQLPAGWQPAPATPLVAQTEDTAAASDAASAGAPTLQDATPGTDQVDFAPAETAENPTGLRF